jgi:signal transduction histidine kinase/ligand-binding sensor domain-containing protein/DNA-binding response OmpR family regulator
MKRKLAIVLKVMLLLSGFENTHAAKEILFQHINIGHGLSRNEITAIYQDKTGFFWFGTSHGLNRYDGHNFKIFLNSPGDLSSIADNYITSIHEDNTGKLWIGHRKGYCIYDPLLESFIPSERYFQNLGYDDFTFKSIFMLADGLILLITSENIVYQYRTSSSILEEWDLWQWGDEKLNPANSAITSIVAMDSRSIWMILADGTLFWIDPQNQKIKAKHDHIKSNQYYQTGAYQLYIDSDNNLWIYIANQAGGLFFLETKTNEWHHFSSHSSKGTLNNNSVMAIVQDKNRNIWVGTDHGGINIINLYDFSVQYILNNPTKKHSLSQNVITALYKDRADMIWVGTYKNGINQHHEELIRFPLIQNLPNDIHSLPFNDINCFEEDKMGNVWIGTNGGGLLYYNRIEGNFVRYQHDPLLKGSISSDIIVSLLLDADGELWIGTYLGGLNRYLGNGQFEQYNYNPNSSNTLSDNKIWTILEAFPEIIWIGTLNGSIDILNKRTSKIIPFSEYYNIDFSPDEINTIKKDHLGNFWVGTSKGLYMVNIETRVLEYFSSGDHQNNTISNDIINDLFIDDSNRIWIATCNGLNIYDFKSETFKLITSSDGLPDNDIRALTKDKTGNIWLSTARGIARIENPTGWYSDFPNSEPNITRFNESDGLQGWEFNNRSVLLNIMGEILFGGPSGFNIFDPATIARNTRKPDVVFTELQVLNQTIRPGESLNNRVVLPSSMLNNPPITLKYKENIFSISFAALSFFNPSRNSFAYMLEGFNRDWIYLPSDEPHRVTYTNLSPGEYIFRVKAANNDGVWNKDGVEIFLKILPPFYRTRAAYIFYILLLISMLWFARHLVIQRERMKFEIENQKLEALRQQELDRLKIKFFTNMSHEFRTPLSLIISPLRDMVKDEKDKQTRDKFNLIYRNASRLLNMVNQLLDFRKIDVQGISLNMTNNDIVKFIKKATYNFLDLSERKNISLTFFADTEQYVMDFDPDKMEKIIFNLLSNALKFTQDSGFVKVELITQNNDVENSSTPLDDGIIIKVTDNGIGIAPEKQNLIFNRYYQDEDDRGLFSAGTGIGLSLTQEFVKLHAGTIRVESSPGNGSCFIVSLPGSPKGENVSATQKSIRENMQVANPTLGKFAREITLLPGKSTLLIVEDNEDFRFYLKDNLNKHFNIIEAENALEGLELVAKYIPDIIISDIMMKGADGFELCEKIKKNTATAHIPVILTTAQALEKYRVTGYNTGADAYMVKPFAIEVLKARIDNLLVQKKTISYSWKSIVEQKAGKNPVTSHDEDFIKKTIDVIEEQIGNPDYSVQELSNAMNISRGQLYKNLMTLTGKSPIDFIRFIRIKRAAYLLRNSQLTVSEICYRVGYNTPKYFTGHFKKQYNVTPSEYRNAGKKSTLI